MRTHESFHREHAVARASERSFGHVFAVVLALVAAYRFWRGHGDWAWWLAGGAVFLLLARLWTAPLAPLNRAWAALGRLLHAIVTPLLMGIIYALAIVPTGLLLRLAGKDILRLRRDETARSYWIEREPGPGRPDAMKDQF